MGKSQNQNQPTPSRVMLIRFLGAKSISNAVCFFDRWKSVAYLYLIVRVTTDGHDEESDISTKKIDMIPKYHWVKQMV